MLFLNRNVLSKNLKLIKDKCDFQGVDLRPHVKTIHDESLSSLLRDSGITKISVSNLDMFHRFAKAGWTDISLAIPFPQNYMRDIQGFLDQGILVSVYIDNKEQFELLKQLTSPLNVCIEIDLGQLRTGIHWKYSSEIINLIQDILDSNHSLSCITSHFGDLYDIDGKETFNLVFSDLMTKILNLKEQLDQHFSEPIQLALGDTPSILGATIFEQTFELRAGNFMLNDLMIQSKGFCEFSDIGCLVQAQVISKSESDSRFVLHCGAVHLSKDKHPLDSINYGLVAPVDSDWPEGPLADTSIVDLYQEHAVVHSIPRVVNFINIGDLFWVFPVHSCLTVDAMYHKNKINYL